MSVGILGVMLYVSLFLGLVGLFAFIWGIKNHQFDDAQKIKEGALFDGEEELNLAKQQEEKRRKNV